MLDRTLLGTGLDVGTCLQKHIGSSQNVLARIGRKSNMVRATVRTSPVESVGRVARLVAEIEPNSRRCTLIDSADIRASARKFRGLVLKRRTAGLISLVPIDVLIPTQRMPVRVIEQMNRAENRDRGIGTSP